MKRSRKWLAAILGCALLLGTAAYAAGTYSKSITVDYLDIKLQVNGQAVIPRDVDGKEVDPFAYEGTTYLPVRAVSQALGKVVSWDQQTKTVIVEEPETEYAGTWNVVKISNDGANLPGDDLFFSFQLKEDGTGIMTVKSGDSFDVTWKGEDGAILVTDEYGSNNIEGTVEGNLMVVNHEGLIVTLKK